MNETASYMMAAAVLVSSVALVMNALASMGMLRAVKKLQQEVSPLIPQARQTMELAQQTLSETARDLKEITTQAKQVITAAEQQVQYFDAARSEITSHLKIQTERVELVLEDVLSRVQDVAGVVHGSVLRPVREVSGLVAGVKAAVQTLMMGRRPTVDRATHDEEMFI
jgi:F0F1-type ATP synthase membrane subunit b/b'